VAALAVGWMGCASSSRAERSSESSKTNGESRTPSAPTPEELENSPCGNPNWAELPDQHEVDGDPEKASESEGESEQDEGGSEGRDDEPAADEEQ